MSQTLVFVSAILHAAARFRHNADAFQLTSFPKAELPRGSVPSSCSHVRLRQSSVAADIPTTGADELAKSSPSSFDKFDYRSHWYPVVWARDLPPSKPMKVTLFDTDYVLAKLVDESGGRSEEGEGEGEVVAMVDACPHKLAALSDGRVTSCGSFQCAYHGWTFDGATGRCLEVPQVESRRSSAGERLDRGGGGGGGPARKGRADGTAVPAMIHQGMVWLFPFGGLEEALKAPPPPTVPEIEKPGFRVVSTLVRDFPDVDWTILLENIMDPDHGLFAHQAQAFDLYTASKANPQTIVEHEMNGGKGWTITSTTDSVPKLLARNDEMAGKSTQKRVKRNQTPVDNVTKKDKSGKDVVINRATTTFAAPSMVYMGRRDPSTAETSFVTAFWICPIGTGKSRFMSAAIGKVPGWLNIPRWFSHVNVNNFLDQDTHLLATQHRHVLATESRLFLQQAEREEVNGGGGGDEDGDVRANLPVRKTLYAYRSPTERLGVRIGSFFDATIGRAPGRAKAMRNLGGYERVMSEPTPPREVVLDRYAQHTKICRESMDVVRNCEKVQVASKIVGAIPLLVKALFAGVTSMSAKTSLMVRALYRCNSFLNARPGLVIGTWIAAAVAHFLADKLRKEFYFKYTNDYRERDMDKIPGGWMDHV